MKNVSRSSSSSSSKFSSCFRPVVDLDAMLDPPPSSLHRSSSFRMACLPPKHHTAVDHHPPKPTFSLLFKALAIQTRVNVRARPSSRHGSKRRSSGDDGRTMHQDTEASNIPETKAEQPSFCWSSGSESESLSDLSCSDIPDDKKRWREGKSEKQKKSERLGIFMVVFSLTLTVLVGKYWGALLTSAWLYLLCLVKAGNEKTSPGQEEQSRGGMVGS